MFSAFDPSRSESSENNFGEERFGDSNGSVQKWRGLLVPTTLQIVTVLVSIDQMSNTVRHNDDSLLSFAFTVLGSVVALVGTVALSTQLLDPACFIGAVNYVTVGAILMFSNSKRIQNAAYDCVPQRMKTVLFESSVLDLFQDQSRCVQLAAYLIACMTLPESKVQKLYRTLPDRLEDCKRRTVCSVLSDTEAEAVGYAKPLDLYETREMPINGSDFTARALRESAAQVASHIFTEVKIACTRAVASLADQVAAAAQEYAPCAGLISASLLIYWNLLQQHVPHWRQLAAQLHGAERLCWEYLRKMGPLPALSSEACGTSLAVLTKPAALVVCGVAASGVKAYCSKSNTGNTASKVVGSHCPELMAVAPVERLSTALFALVVALRECRMMAFAHPLCSLLLPRLTTAVSRRERSSMRVAGVTGPGLDVVQARQTQGMRIAALRLSQCLVMALALRLGAPFAHYRWLVSVLYLRICRGCRISSVE